MGILKISEECRRLKIKVYVSHNVGTRQDFYILNSAHFRLIHCSPLLSLNLYTYIHIHTYSYIYVVAHEYQNAISIIRVCDVITRWLNIMIQLLYIYLNCLTYKTHLLCPILCYSILSIAYFLYCIFRNFQRKAPFFANMYFT